MNLLRIMPAKGSALIEHEIFHLFVFRPPALPGMAAFLFHCVLVI